METTTNYFTEPWKQLKKLYHSRWWSSLIPCLSATKHWNKDDHHHTVCTVQTLNTNTNFCYIFIHHTSCFYFGTFCTVIVWLNCQGIPIIFKYYELIEDDHKTYIGSSSLFGTIPLLETELIPYTINYLDNPVSKVWLLSVLKIDAQFSSLESKIFEDMSYFPLFFIIGEGSHKLILLKIISFHLNNESAPLPRSNQQPKTTKFNFCWGGIFIGKKNHHHTTPPPHHHSGFFTF